MQARAGGTLKVGCASRFRMLSESMRQEPILKVSFFRTAGGREPVREWLKALPDEERRIIGGDLKTVQFGWPLGMPLVRKLEHALWEIRVRLPDRIARLFFTCEEGLMILLHAFIKKSQKTPAEDLELAKTRLRMLHS
jgi:phage-related protein